MTAVIQAALNTAQSDRLKQLLNMTPRILDVYFSVALQVVNDCMILLFEISFKSWNFLSALVKS